ncbi:aminopeptidase [Clostridium thermarum]|uniref:aminopeptidase n=1 Tax=Clostridium thermarum TaxID=1716543 RepID=UPI00111DFA28|nr:aminopeptidase [Clostridium thermarum]
MKDARMLQLAKNLVNYSCEVKKGEKVLIEAYDLDEAFVAELVKQVYLTGGIPFVTIKQNAVNRSIYMGCTEEQLKLMAKYEAQRMSEMDVYIGVRGGNNSSQLSDVPGEKMSLYQKYFWATVHGEIRVPKTRWVVLRYPTASMAQSASMSTEGFEDFYFNVCNLDYSKMSKAMDALVDIINRTDKVHIKGEGTDLTFSIKGMHGIKCDGKVNIPDGEVYTAPVRDSVNGYITYNTPAVYEGFTYENIRLEFKDGKIIKATANDTERINKVFDTDEGARYVGEFAIGVNPYILYPMKDTLFDEKIAGSIHFTPGKSYEDCFNGNVSAIHWDLVYIQRPEYGGGEIYFDDVLIRKDGIFVIDELKQLNPENLK